MRVCACSHGRHGELLASCFLHCLLPFYVIPFLLVLQPPGFPAGVSELTPGFFWNLPVLHEPFNS